jgi:hypothetical protein
MSEIADRIKEFLGYAELLSGDEKGQAKVFCDRLFKAFGHTYGRLGRRGRTRKFGWRRMQR